MTIVFVISKVRKEKKRMFLDLWLNVVPFNSLYTCMAIAWLKKILKPKTDNDGQRRQWMNARPRHPLRTKQSDLETNALSVTKSYIIVNVHLKNAFIQQVLRGKIDRSHRSEVKKNKRQRVCVYRLLKIEKLYMHNTNLEKWLFYINGNVCDISP